MTEEEILANEHRYRLKTKEQKAALLDRYLDLDENMPMLLE